MRRAVLECLKHIAEKEALVDIVEQTIEALIVGGDLLELNDVVTDDTNVRGTWVFAAPPSFVVRRSGSFFLFGVVSDQDAFLPESIYSRIIYQGHCRIINPGPDESLAEDLQAHGLQRLSENAWLKYPKAQSANSYLDELLRRLAAQPPSGAVSNLQIIDATRPVNYYRGRWTEPKSPLGHFVARRPQEFGVPIWGLAGFENGELAKFLDFPLEGSRWRGCDTAWHLQMAIDSCRGSPQRCRRTIVDDGIRLDFFSPLPMWSERRLMIFGRPMPPEKCLISYWLPSAEAEAEEEFLRERLWISFEDDS